MGKKLHKKTITIRELLRVAGYRKKRGLPPEPSPILPPRPKVRGDCMSVPRPCPWRGCRHNLSLEANSKGSIRLFETKGPRGEDLPSCSLDEAERGPKTLEEVGEILSVSRERVRQEQDKAIDKLKDIARLALH